MAFFQSFVNQLETFVVRFSTPSMLQMANHRLVFIIYSIQRSFIIFRSIFFAFISTTKRTFALWMNWSSANFCWIFGVRCNIVDIILLSHVAFEMHISSVQKWFSICASRRTNMIKTIIHQNKSHWRRLEPYGKHVVHFSQLFRSASADRRHPKERAHTKLTTNCFDSNAKLRKYYL